MTSLTTIDPHLKIELRTTKENGVRLCLIYNIRTYLRSCEDEITCSFELIVQTNI